jgi:hypothetical protein
MIQALPNGEQYCGVRRATWCSRGCHAAGIETPITNNSSLKLCPVPRRISLMRGGGRDQETARPPECLKDTELHFDALWCEDARQFNYRK